MIEYDLEQADGYIHENDLPDLDHLRDHVIGIMEAVYESGDIKKLESS